ncbi:MAG: class I SAM-dependent methyltransferase [Candidatus Sericytochromatia bacterium]
MAIIPEKISPTAHLTSHAWDYLGISNAKYFVDPTYKNILNTLRLLGFPLFLNKRNDYIYYLLEPRHRAIDFFVFSKFYYKQVIEIACGLSPRGFTFSENPEFNYIEADLPKMIEAKKNLVKNIYKQKNIKRDNHKFFSLDILNDNIYEKLSNHTNKEKTIVITEGLTIYFDMEHLKKIFSNIANFLRKNDGGVYICDIYHSEDIKKPHNKLMNFAINFMGVKFFTDIDNAEEGQNFLKDCGFDFVECINPLTLSKQLGLKNNIPPEYNLATIYLAHVF